jgi:putative FmdB family regulatory protein
LPIYEYSCPACELEFERFQGIDAKVTTECPECGKTAVRRMSKPYHIYKGWDFPTNDIKRKKHWREQDLKKNQEENNNCME